MSVCHGFILELSDCLNRETGYIHDPSEKEKMRICFHDFNNNCDKGS